MVVSLFVQVVPVPGAELLRDLVKATILALANLLSGGPEAGFLLALPVIAFYVVFLGALAGLGCKLSLSLVLSRQGRNKIESEARP